MKTNFSVIVACLFLFLFILDNGHITASFHLFYVKPSFFYLFYMKMRFYVSSYNVLEFCKNVNKIDDVTAERIKLILYIVYTEMLYLHDCFFSCIYCYSPELRVILIYLLLSTYC